MTKPTSAPSPAAPPTDTRSRVLEAAWRLIGTQGDASVSLLDVARAAGVSRQTVYVQFHSRAGLLLAMVDHRDSTSPQLARMREAGAKLPVDDMLEEVIRQWFDYVPQVFNVASALSAAAVNDADARAAFASRMDRLHGGLLSLTGRLRAEGRLAEAWTVETAAAWWYHLMHIDTWRHLVLERGWRPEAVVEWTVKAVRMMLLR